MRFYALRVLCETCGTAFLVGGAAVNDLDVWRSAAVVCRSCGARVRAADGKVVGLSAQRSRGTPERPGVDPTRA